MSMSTAKAGKKGGEARARALSAERRKEIASNAGKAGAAARWLGAKKQDRCQKEQN